MIRETQKSWGSRSAYNRYNRAVPTMRSHCESINVKQNGPCRQSAAEKSSLSSLG